MGFFTSEGTKSVSFNEKEGFNVGTVWSGVITVVGDEQQATVFGTGEPEFWAKSGQPRMTLPITIQAEQVQKTAEDDGQRSIWFKDGHGLKKALAVAIKNHPQAREPEVGDYIAVKWAGWDDAAKVYEAKWEPGKGKFFTESQPAQSQQRPAQGQQQPNPVTGSWDQQTAAAPADAPF